MRALLLTLTLVAQPVMAADQFDLLCSGGKEQMHYRLDLAAGEYCFGACERVMRIAEVTSGMITLFNIEPSPPQNMRGYNRINRLTGAWEWYNHDPRYAGVQDVKGTCTPADFSGFGTNNRKF